MRTDNVGQSQTLANQLRVLTTSAEIRAVCLDAPRPLGLVPTMGALHDGHLSLVDRARDENASVAVSIFVNPAQFGPGEDLDEYPRDLEGDLDLLRRHGVDMVYAPGVDQVYPEGFGTWVDVGPIASRLEGAHRPGHFRGVATVVSKLFNVTRPDRAYFGQKDGQQTVVVKQMARDLDLGVDVVVLPTVRAEDGLALSSRNVRLTPEQRCAAPVLYRALALAWDLWMSGEHDATRLRDAAEGLLRGEPRVDRIDYVSVADAETLEELDTVVSKAMVSAAVHMGHVRLIDNLLLG